MTIEYKEKKSEGEHDDKKVETPKDTEVKDENKEKAKLKQFNRMNLQYYIYKGWRKGSMISSLQSF